jgi:DNA-binding CsgD family transcriptional regulator
MAFLELFGESDAQRFRQTADKLNSRTPAVNVSGVLLPEAGGRTTLLDAALATVESGGRKAIVIALLPASTPAKVGSETQTSKENGARVEELVSSLSRQLASERLTRQIIGKLHASLDRDSVLQTTVDFIGRALKASACLLVRTDGPATSLVTHEYADANLSPLGLGRSGQLPQGIVACFKQRTVAVNDLSNPTRPAGLTKDDQLALMDNGVGAMIGTPIIHHGTVHGIIIVESESPREWPNLDIEMLETIAAQAALALANAQAFAHVKDQLFNMNLLSNLTQQLTNALDVAGRAARSDKPAEPGPVEGSTTPLSSRELEVLKLIASGLANREIAQKLFLTESTVELHASRIRKKLKLKSRTALVKFACDNHLV